MKATKILISFLILTLTFSCKKDEKTAQEEPATSQPEVKTNVFTITLNATVKKDDSFQVYFKQEDGAPFKEENSLFKEFKGSDKPQDIVFDLPEDLIPNYIRLDFGTNKEQQEVVIHDFKMSFAGKSFDAKGADFFNYMVVNELTMKADKAKSSVTPIITKEGTYDPITYSGKELYDQIQTMIK